MILREEIKIFNKEKTLYYQELMDKVIVDLPHANTTRLITAPITNE